MQNPNARLVQRLLSQTIPVLSSYHAEMVAGDSMHLPYPTITPATKPINPTRKDKLTDQIHLN